MEMTWDSVDYIDKIIVFWVMKTHINMQNVARVFVGKVCLHIQCINTLYSYLNFHNLGNN